MKKRPIRSIDSNGNAVETYDSIMDAERKLGVAFGSISKVMGKHNTISGFRWEYIKNGEPQQKRNFKSALSEEELRAKHDNFFKIKEAVAELQKGIFIPESEFITSLGLSGGYRRWLESSELNKYRGRAGGINYYSHPESIEKLKADAVLS